MRLFVVRMRYTVREVEKAGVRVSCAATVGPVAGLETWVGNARAEVWGRIDRRLDTLGMGSD